MNEVPPELAAKVAAADLRNHIKRVGDGGNLSPADRQMFIAFASQSDQQTMLEARTASLLKKWLFGARLTKEEQAEIAHVIPNAPRRVTCDQYEHGPDDYDHLAIKRRTFFRWKAHGEANPGGPDLPPYDQPEEIEGWYERMKSRGIFKHRFPKEIREAISRHLRSTGPAKRPVQGSQPTSTAVDPGETATVPSAFTTDHGERGLAFEIKAEEHRVASLRVARDQAYRDNRRSDGDVLDRQYRDALDQLSKIKQRAIKTLEQEGQMVSLDQIEREWGPRLETIVQGGMMFYDRIAPQIEALPDHASKRKLWREKWIEHCRVLAEGRFAPTLQLEALTE